MTPVDTVSNEEMYGPMVDTLGDS